MREYKLLIVITLGNECMHTTAVTYKNMDDADRAVDAINNRRTDIFDPLITVIKMY